MEKSQRSIKKSFKQCIVCKYIYRTKPSHFNRRKYCSYNCFNKDRKTTLKGDNNPCWRGGKPKCEDCKKTLSFHYRNRCRDCFIKYNQGKNHYNWQGGITKLSAKIRNSHKYRLWRKSILERDNYTCQICNQVGGELNVDHIKGFAKYPRLRFKESNARTLCVSCHKLTDNYLYKAIYA